MTKASSNQTRNIKLAYLWHPAPSRITADLGKLKTAACRRQAAGGTLVTSTFLSILILSSFISLTTTPPLSKSLVHHPPSFLINL
ncbi:hypothetical protein BJX65DRAFT_84474 [Aspergillus insuetus]